MPQRSDRRREFENELNRQRPLIYERSQGICEAWATVAASAFEVKERLVGDIRMLALRTPEWDRALSEYVEADPCTGTATEVQHRAGRGPAGSNALSDLLHLCAGCHRWATDHGRAAIQLGVSRSRL